MESQLTVFAVIISAILLSCYGKSVHLETKALSDEQISSYCDELCRLPEATKNGPGCPPMCAQRYLGPWARREMKRGFVASPELRGITFDDYSWFMKLLGRNVV